MISFISVNWNSYDFARVLIESIISYTTCPYEIIIVDNSIVKEKINYPHTRVLPQRENIGHGSGLNLGIYEAKFPYTCFLDIDCHILKRHWQNEFLNLMSEFSVIGGRGVPAKPIRPACMFMHTKTAQQYNYCSTPGYKGHRITPDGFDVAIQAYHHMVEDNVKIKLIDSVKNRYGTANGEEWVVNTPVIYHHWHGSHLKERQVDFQHNLIVDKEKLFSQLPWRVL